MNFEIEGLGASLSSLTPCFRTKALNWVGVVVAADEIDRKRAIWCAMTSCSIAVILERSHGLAVFAPSLRSTLDDAKVYFSMQKKC